LTTAYLNRIATAVPEHDVHNAFVVFAEKMLADPRLRTVFRRMVRRANIAHRYSFLDPQKVLANSRRMTRLSFIGWATFPHGAAYGAV
jgi:alpha-pyrone synthase